MASSLHLLSALPLPESVDSDAALLDRARVDRAAFAPIYRRYAPDIYRYCYRCLGCREDAEDATSQVFTQALSKLAQLQDDNIRPWIYRIAHNVVIDMSRKARPTASLDDADAASSNDPSPESEALASEQRERLMRALATLSGRDRQLVQLRLSGLTGEEIAVVLDCSHGAIRVAHHRAMERLRVILSDQEAHHA
ncbi:RNA polymerase sigma factor SigW [soil metagenome]